MTADHSYSALSPFFHRKKQMLSSRGFNRGISETEQEELDSTTVEMVNYHVQTIYIYRIVIN